MSGYIKLHRSMTEWGWYKDGNTVRVFLHLLLTANHKDGEYMGRKVLRGQVVFGRKELSAELCVSEKSVRTALEHLKATGELATQSASKFTIGTIVNYSKYQDVTQTDGQTEGHTNGQETASNGPANGQQVATSKNIRMEEGKKENDSSSLRSEESTSADPKQDDRFDEFWKAYPRKDAKPKAASSWRTNVKQRDIEPLMKALEAQKRSDQWTREGGKYIPLPTTWLNQRRWEDQGVIEIQGGGIDDLPEW